jgi:recA bacterial DNA recombination protein
MSSAVISTSAALGRPFLFDTEPDAQVCSQALALVAKPGMTSPLAEITPASRLQVRPAPDMASTGIASLDAMTGGLPRGCVTEICGPASSGRTSILLAVVSAATCRGEFCTIADASDALDTESMASAGVELAKLLWVRCTEKSPQNTEKNQKKQSRAHARSTNLHEQRLEQLMRATDMLLESGGFGLIALDLAGLPAEAARRIPLTTWFRFRRAVEHKPTILLVIAQQPIAGSCSSLVLKTSMENSRFSVPSLQTQLLTRLDFKVEITRSRFGSWQFADGNFRGAQRKPAASVSAAFTSKTAWG